MGKRMINYSVYMMRNSLKPNLPEKAYAKAQVKEVMSFRDFVAHIAEHGGYKRGQVKGVLSDMCSCLVEQLLEGKKVMLDELGNFWLSISSEGAESCETFTSKNITAVNIIFTPGTDFENLIGRASFNPVASRSLQTAALKAEKKGENVIDIEAVKKGPGNGGGNTGKPSNPSEGTGSNTGENTGEPSNPSGGAGRTRVRTARRTRVSPIRRAVARTVVPWVTNQAVYEVYSIHLS